MAELTLEIARKILDVALAKGVEKKLKPLVVTVLDARGCVKISAAQDGTSLLRSEIAHGKAYGALAMGIGSRALFQRAQDQAFFIGDTSDNDEACAVAGIESAGLKANAG